MEAKSLSLGRKKGQPILLPDVETINVFKIEKVDE